jgi:hypothetical protein
MVAAERMVGPVGEGTGMCLRGQPEHGCESVRPRKPAICEGSRRPADSVVSLHIPAKGRGSLEDTDQRNFAVLLISLRYGPQ